MLSSAARSRHLALILVGVSLACAGCGQLTRGNSVEGDVSVRMSGPTDPFGAPAGPTETAAADPATGVRLLRDAEVAMSTNVSNGHFVFRDVPPGRYRVCANFLGTPSDTSAPFDAVPGRTRMPGTLTLADTGLVVGNNTLRLAGAAIFHLTLSRARVVDLRLYDGSGRLMRTLSNRVFPGGEHSLQWDGTDDAGVRLPSGVYVAILKKDTVATVPGQMFGVRGTGRFDTPQPGRTYAESLAFGRAHIRVQ